MEDQILGLHHVTAIAVNAQRNYDFYTKVLGLRLVKKTVNFDDPGTYHFYYGNERGEPGTILTFFPWEDIGKGRNGTGMATEIAYTVPEGSFEFWKERFGQYKVNSREPVERFGETYLPFADPDGLEMTLIVPKMKDERGPWTTGEVNEEAAIKGFYNVSLTLKYPDATANILTNVLGYRQTGQEGNRYRFLTDAVPAASVIDILTDDKGHSGYNAGGTVHHIAFRVKDEETQMRYREKVLQAGLQATPKIDRDYFFSIYFREPGGVLFEIATENPGFTRDESLSELGSHLKLPKQFEQARNKIEKVLPVLKTI